MRRIPFLSTVVVGATVAAMIALGLWQLLVRLPQKQAYIAQLSANPARPPVAFPREPDDRLLFRRTAATCLAPVTINRAGAGKAGFRLIATCRAGAGADHRIKVQLGTTRDPHAMIRWRGGRVTGWISHAPSSTSLIASLLVRTPQELLLVADRPAPALAANTQPTASLVPDNHLSYAVQWFFFAAIAAVIYAVALRARLRAQSPGRA